MIVLDFEIGNETNTFLETAEDGEFSPERVLPEK